MAEKDDDKGTGGGGGTGTPPAGGGTGGGGGAASVDKGTVREVVADVLGDLFKSGRADVDDAGDDKGKGGRRRRTAADDDDDDIGRQVEAAVRKVQEKDARTKAEQEREDRIKALEEKTATPEKLPKQVRRVTRFMWGDED